MAAKGSEMALALVVVLMMWHGAWAQSGCSNALMSLAPCLNFVTGNVTKPSSPCCSSLMQVIQTQPQCLCTMMNGGGAAAGFAINQTLALALPAACNLQTPPVSQCNAARGPTTSVPSPASAPGVSPSSDSIPSDDTPVTTDTPSTSSQTNTPSSTGTGSKSTPSTTGGSSGASTTSPLPVVMLVSLAVSFALRTTKF